ncbi:hypothetical protein CerSpe_238830 [Prunus speciosa]
MELLRLMQDNWEMNYQDIKVITHKINELWGREECYWRQRSRIKWLIEGDSNTSYFHQSTIQRRRQNKIARIKDHEGRWVDNPKKIRHTIEAHFKELFTTSGNRDWSEAIDCVPSVVTDEMNIVLTSPVTEQEVKEVASQMGGMRAPRLDGFQGIFYQSYWDIIQVEVQGTTNDFFNGTTSPQTLNATHIALVPKTACPESIS